MQSLGAALDEAPATDAVNLQHELESIRGNARDPKHALLVALEEAIVEQRGGGPASVTEVFAAGMSAVEAYARPNLVCVACWSWHMRHRATHLAFSARMASTPPWLDHHM